MPGSLPPQQRGGDGSLLPPGPVASAVPSWGHFLEWGNKDWKRRTRKEVIWVYWASSLFFFFLCVWLNQARYLFSDARSLRYLS